MKWNKPPSDFIKQVTDKLDKQYRTFAIDCYNNVVALSPVDTGRYRRSHHVSIGTPSFAENGAGVGAIMGIAKGNYPTIFVQTNLPYSIRLENGWSKQAPTGVYQNAFNSAKSKLG